MSSFDYYKWFAYQCDWLSFSNKKNKIEYVKYIFEYYLEYQNWDYIKFSNKINFK